MNGETLHIDTPDNFSDNDNTPIKLQKDTDTIIKEHQVDDIFTIGENKEEILSFGLYILMNNAKFKNFNEEKVLSLVRLYKKSFNYSGENRLKFPVMYLIDPSKEDIIGALYENYMHTKIKNNQNGQFFTPYNLVNYMVTLLNLKDDPNLLSKKFIDISCGSGIFLTNAVKNFIRLAQQHKVSDSIILDAVLNNFYGLDKDPISCLISKINLFILCINEIDSNVTSSIPILNFNIYLTDSISKNNIEEREVPNIYNLKNKLGEFSQGFDYIIGNPPYIEAKKLPKYVKEVVRQNFPNFANGAFDLYIPFVAQCYNISAIGGKICLVLPNKFTVANYALALREFLLEKTQIDYIVDFSEARPFVKADVYPVVLLFSNKLPKETHKVHTIMSVRDFNELNDSSRIIYLPQEIYKKATKFKTFYWLPFNHEFYRKLNRIFETGTKLSKFLEIRTTVSFHKKGQRERFVKKLFYPEKNIEIPLRKYLGGQSHSRKNEVEKFRVNWDGYYIKYDTEALKREKNNLPPISIFEKPKIIFCQHAKEITATFDRTGEWVTKDVYPIAFSREGAVPYPPLLYFTGLFNSKFFNFLYGILFKGIQISQGYFHYLPSWLGELPVLLPSDFEIKKICSIVETLLVTDNKLDMSLMNEIDEIIYKAYDLNHKDIQMIEQSLHERMKREPVSK